MGRAESMWNDEDDDVEDDEESEGGKEERVADVGAT